MRSGTQALLPFVALVVGFVAGTGFGVVVLSDGSGDAGEPAAYDSARHRTDDVPSGDPAPGEAAPSGSRRRGVSTDDVMVENALRGTAGMPATSGDGVVTGTVRDALGNPLPDVTIVATTGIDELEELPEDIAEQLHGEDESLEAQIRRIVWRHRFEQATRRQATTGPDGSYRLEGLVQASYHLEPTLAGWRFSAPGDGEWGASPGGTRDFIASPVVGVSVAVTMPDGSIPEDANVWYAVTGSGDTTHFTWTPDGEPLELGVGLYSFSASGGAHDAYSVDQVPIEVTEDGQAVVELRLAPRPGVVGKVEFSGEERPLSVGIAALDLDGGGDADPARLMSAPHATWVTDPYEFSLLDMEQGTYLVGAVLRNGTVLDSVVLEVSDTPIERTFSIGNVDVRDYVVVRARAPDGAPVTDVTFQIGYQAGEHHTFEGNLSLEPEADGSYRVPIAVPGGPEDGYHGWSRSGEHQPGATYPGLTCYIQAMSPRFGTKRQEYDPRADREIELAFSEPAFAVVTVGGYASSKWRGRVEATLHASRTDEAWNHTWLSDDQRRMTPQGVARVGPVAPGSYVVSLMVLSEQNGYRRVTDIEVMLGVGDTPVTLTLPDLHDLVMVVDGEQLDLDLHRDPGPNETTDFLDEGVMNGRSTTFSALAPGRYRVRHFGEGSTGEMMVDVPASGPVPFRAVAYNSLRVENVPEQLVDHLQQGDVIVRIGGEEMDGERRVRAALALAGTQDTVLLTVRRGAREMDIEVPSAGLEQGYLAYWVR